MLMNKERLKYFIRALVRLVSPVISSLLPGRLRNKFKIYRITRRWPNMDHPQRYNDHLLLYIGSDFMESCSRYADKIAVRGYVKDVIGSEVLSTVYGIYDSFDEINFSTLPERFYLKTNHGSGWNLPCIDKDEFILNAKNNKKLITGWMRKNYYRSFGERQYKNIQPKLYAEEYINSELPENMLLKIFTFAGKAEFIQVTGRIGEDQIVNNFYDCSWAPLPFTIGRRHAEPNLKRPDRLEQMVRMAELLAKPFPFVRVDLYFSGARIIFSELTFSPSAAHYAVSPEEWSYKLGRMFPPIPSKPLGG
jgi:hypothetical protein